MPQFKEIVMILYLLMLCAHSARARTCFAPVVCSEGSDTLPDWIHVELNTCSENPMSPAFLRAPQKGEKGEPGSTGATGLPGLVGPPGKPGDEGEPGSPGSSVNLPSGPPAEKGDRGVPGLDGRDGLPGERGARGEKGEEGRVGLPGDKGEKGEEAMAWNVTMIESMKADVKDMKIKMDAILTHVSEIDERLKALERGNCTVKYKSSCFIPVMFPKMNLKRGKKKCSNLGGSLANIYNPEHLNSIINFIRNKRMGGARMHRFHLGMTLDFPSMEVKLSNGTGVTFTEWSPGYPKVNPNRTSLVLHVSRDPNADTITNERPSLILKLLCELPNNV